MTEQAIPFGTISKNADYFEGRLSRTFAHPTEAVWRMLTADDAVPLWLAPGTIELKQGGKVHIDFADSGIVIDSEVTAFADGFLLEYSWSSGDQPKRPLRFEIHAKGDESELTLQVRIPASEDPAKACAGFEAHLEMFATALEGIPTKFPFQVFMDARGHYSKQLEA